MTEDKKYPLNHAEEVLQCPNCGAEITGESRFCMTCGLDLLEPSKPRVRRPAPMNLLYGPPEVLRGNRGGAEIMNTIYGSPEMLEEIRESLEPMNDVYGGPEPPDDDPEEDPINGVYEGPEPMVALYAAPAPPKSLLSRIKDKLKNE